MKLKLSKDFSIPIEAVTQTFGILAIRGVGKTYTASVLAEEMLEAQLPIVVLDPTGAWWGLRASADGRGPGYPIVVMGGDHGDVPLEPTAGEVLADFAVEERQPLVLDLSHFRKSERARFTTDFCERLYLKNRKALHIFIDEADAFAPQRPMHGEERMLGALEDIVRRGRIRGLGVTLITQRAAVINKDVLSQVEVLIALRTIGSHDRTAIDAWIEAHGTKAQREKMMESLASLPKGTAWFWSPGWLDEFRKIQIRERRTFNSSATPKVGEKLIEPRKLASVDLDALSKRIAETIQRVKSEDPRELKRQIQELQKRINVPAKTAPIQVKRIEVPILNDSQVSRLEKAAQRFHEIGNTSLETSRALVAMIAKAAHLMKTNTPSPSVHASVHVPVRSSVHAPNVASDGHLPKSERLILSALAQYPNGRTKVQTAIITGYSVNSGGFNNSLAKLRSSGYLEGYGGNLKITDVGLQQLGNYEPLPTGTALLNHWCTRLPKCERSILSQLFEVNPNAISKDDLANRTGYSGNSGGFNNALSRLRTLELISRGSEIKISEELL